MVPRRASGALYHRRMPAEPPSHPSAAAGPPRAQRPDGPPVLRLDGVTVRRAGATILGPLDWAIAAGERWVLLGPNGSGKTTLLEVASTMLWPSEGTVEVLGERIGAVDARTLRRRVGYASPALAAAIPAELTPLDIVVSAREAALAPWWHRFGPNDRDRAAGLLDQLGVGALRERRFSTLSTGERQRVLIARALMPDPDLLLLDEPAAGLDLGGRERLVAALESLAGQRRPLGIVLVTHHVEEIPRGFGHALLLRDGRAVAAGPIEAALTADTLGAAFDERLRLDQGDGRFHARAAT
jgi:iron complex transport system ATP-binding protein